jgi:protein-tyrosine phosphatase
MEKKLLFICTGNYYRSRYAEIFFNEWVGQHDLPWRATSRGLRFSGNNIGHISPYVLQRLDDINPALQGDFRSPIILQESDLQSADLIIAMKESEHKPMMEAMFPMWHDWIAYWDIDDVDIRPPDVVLPLLEVRIKILLGHLGELSLEYPASAYAF